LFIEQETGGGLGRHDVLEGLKHQYRKLRDAGSYERIVLWFDACLFDQSMLCHVLVCIETAGLADRAELLCVDAFPGIDPYDGLGQLNPSQMASVYDRRRPVSAEQVAFAARVDRAFALRDRAALTELSRLPDAPLPWVPAAAARWLLELPDAPGGLRRLERLVLEALETGCEAPPDILAFARAHDTHPLFWGDTTLWSRNNGLASRRPPVVRIEGPGHLLPQWNVGKEIAAFRIHPA
jgi:hypothetical protein